MTLKELLDKVDFDNLAPFIEKTEGSEWRHRYRANIVQDTTGRGA